MTDSHQQQDDEFGPDECNGSGRCTASVHVHGCYSDLGVCDDPTDHPKVSK